ncbi:hypothetical protein [Peribacillus frigoritolerans]|uniref:Uncharacterized protein n=1 Tax=Peribacillus castrilensis TaxID=2897690 RepID=A0AAW9NJZ2_9BACI|nr:hypothetical protein [Peribacillus castrilensis]
MENYNYLVFEQGMSLNDVDNMEVKFFMELLKFRADKREKEGKTTGKKKTGEIITSGRFKGERLVSADEFPI